MEPKVKEERKAKPWTCPTCQFVLGNVLFGQLFITGEMTLNTDGPNLVVRCNNCGGRKIWFTSDRLSAIISELAEQVARKLAIREQTA